MTKLLSKVIPSIAIVAMLASCGGGETSNPQGQLVGQPSKLSYTDPVPLGMVWVPAGVMRMGADDQDMKGGNDSKNRTVQLAGFYMDATEVTNSEYRQFTDWVRDSITHTILGDMKDLDDGSQIVDWKKKINWKSEDVQDAMSAYYIPAAQSIWGKKEFNNMGKLFYQYEAYDYATMSRAKNDADRAQFKISKSIPIYPDTTVWMKMFTYSQNDPIAHQYNWYKAFDEYPVVGVNWNQATAFNRWRTLLWRGNRDSKKQYLEGDFRLPTEEQWEWAARGGRQQSPYPWGGPYVVNKKGCYLANFKPNRGNYSVDGGMYTTKAKSYLPNDYGLYNMSGNVAEWTQSPYLTSAYGSTADMAPELRLKVSDSDPEWMKRKSIRGGSWKDVAYYIQVSTRDYEFQDTAKAYIGFRSIITQIAPGITNKQPRSNR
jgi:formylglycine-generating enzyme